MTAISPGSGPTACFAPQSNLLPFLSDLFLASTGPAGMGVGLGGKKPHRARYRTQAFRNNPGLPQWLPGRHRLSLGLWPQWPPQALCALHTGRNSPQVVRLFLMPSVSGFPNLGPLPTSTSEGLERQFLGKDQERDLSGLSTGGLGPIPSPA